jgi:hypothetical protein
MRTPNYSVICLSVAILNACGGDGGGSAASSGAGVSSTPTPTPTPVVNQSLGGIWKSQYTVTSGANAGDTVNVLALINEQGEFVTVTKNTNNGCASVGFGQGSTTGASASGTANWALIQYTTVNGIATNCTETDGSTSGTSVLNGTVAQRATLTLTDTDTTSNGTVEPAVTTTLRYDSLYGLTPSLNMIAGNYTDGANTLTISSNGSIFEQNPTTGCVVNGTISITNSAYNASSFSLTYANCTGTSAFLNGTTATGLASFDNTVTPNELDASWHGTAGGQPYVIVGLFPQQ